MRLTRLITNDDLGQWWVKDPLDAWMHQHPALECGARTPDRYETVEAMSVGRMRYHRYLAGLECPHCVGTWVGFGVLAATLATRRTRLAGPWRFVMAGLSLNTAAVAAGDAIKYWG
jgi:hypothetical protein